MESPADIKWTGYSLAERDWRWQRVRESAAKAGFDCILVPLCVDGRNLHLSLEQARGTRSDCRFLTCFDNAAVILPSVGAFRGDTRQRAGADMILTYHAKEAAQWLA